MRYIGKIISVLLILFSFVFSQDGYRRSYSQHDLLSKIYGSPNSSDTVAKRGLWKIVAGDVSQKVFVDRLGLYEFSRISNMANLWHDYYASRSFGNSQQMVATKSPYLPTPGTGAIKVVFIGNSLTNYLAFPVLKLSENIYGLNALGYDPLASPKYGTRVTIEKSSGWKTYEARTLISQDKFGIGGNSIRGAAGDTLRYTPGDEYTFRFARIYYLDSVSAGGSLSFDYVVDDGTPTTVTITNNTQKLGVITISGLDANKSHSISIRNITGTDSLTLYGIETYNENGVTGILPYWLNQGGTTAEIFSKNLDFLGTFINTAQPDIFVIWLGANDAANNSTSAANYISYISAIVDTIQANTHRHIVLLTVHDRGNPYGTKDNAFANLVEEYRDSLFALAQRKNVSIWDERYFVEPYDEAFAAGFYASGDIIHPSSAGAEMVAAGLLRYLFRRQFGLIGRHGDQFIYGRFVFLKDAEGETAPQISWGTINSSGQPVARSSGLASTDGDNTLFMYQGYRYAMFGYNGYKSSIFTLYPRSGVSALAIMREAGNNWALTLTANSSNQIEFNANNAAYYFQKSGSTLLYLNNDRAEFSQKITFGGSTVGIYYGAGSPEGVVTASVGSIYLRTDGGTGTTLYVKESGTGNTGWVAK